MITSLFVFARILANPASNVFQKRLTARRANPVFIIGVTHSLLTLAVLPFVVMGGAQALGPRFWLNMTTCALLAVAGNALLVGALQSAGLSVLGPLNAYKSIIGMVLGIFLIGEIPGPMGVAGVGLIFAGSFFILERGPEGDLRRDALRFLTDRGVQLRFAALVCSATEAVFLKRAVLLSSPLLTFTFWSILGVPFSLCAIPFIGRGLRTDAALFRKNWTTYATLAATTGAMQFTTLLTFGKLQVSYSLALFQLSAPVSVLFGRHFFQEGQTRNRLAGACIMAGGAAFIVLSV